MSPLELPSGAPGGGGNTWQALQFCPEEVGVKPRPLCYLLFSLPLWSVPVKNQHWWHWPFQLALRGLGLWAILSPGRGAIPGQCQPQPLKRGPGSSSQPRVQAGFLASASILGIALSANSIAPSTSLRRALSLSAQRCPEKRGKR